MYRRKEKYKTEKEKREAIISNSLNILNIHNPSEELIRLAVEREP